MNLHAVGWNNDYGGGYVFFWKHASCQDGDTLSPSRSRYSSNFNTFGALKMFKHKKISNASELSHDSIPDQSRLD